MKQIEAYETEDGKIFATQQEAELYERRAKGLYIYQVDLFYNGYASVEVWAKNKDDAIEKARDQIYIEDIDFDFTEAEAKMIGG